jgi:hypothetical protein
VIASLSPSVAPKASITLFAAGSRRFHTYAVGDLDDFVPMPAA